MSDGWAILIPLLLGMVAVYWLLPRARGFPPLWGGLAGGLALVLAGALLVRTGVAPAESLLFYAFSAVAVASGILLITQRNPVHAALSFALVVLGTCGLFLLQAAPFLMAATTIVYAGAIVVTFLFVIMLAQQAGLSDADHRSREPLLATVAGFVLLGTILYVLGRTYRTPELGQLDEELNRTRAVQERVARARETGPTPAEGRALLDELDHRLADFESWTERESRALSPAGIRMGDAVTRAQDAAREGRSALDRNRPVDWVKIDAALDGLRDPAVAFVNLQPSGDRPLSNYSGPSPTQAPRDFARDALGRPRMPAANVAALGRSLFTDYLLAVELAGTLLLVATIGAIAIAARRTEVLR